MATSRSDPRRFVAEIAGETPADDELAVLVIAAVLAAVTRAERSATPAASPWVTTARREGLRG